MADFLELVMGLAGRLASGMVVLLASLSMAGCGAGSNGVPGMLPIMVSLTSSTVKVKTDGTPTHVQILITSTSETALVSFVGLPAGVGWTYAASDTNPSGLLTFKAIATAPAGTYMPIVRVNSAGQAATVKFTLIVAAP